MLSGKEERLLMRRNNRLLNILIFLFLLVPLRNINVFAQIFLEHRDNFQLVNWKFHKSDAHSAEDPFLNPGPEWKDITVPHTWNAEDVLTKGSDCYRGIGWYRAEFALPHTDDKKRYFIRFEGVCLVADVFLNGKFIGRHKGGYSAFCFDITPYISFEESNIVAVRVDNTVQPGVAPSGTHLYPLFGGIYRPVTIFATHELCVCPLDYASSGVYIQQKKVSLKEAEIEIKTLLNYNSIPFLRTESPELLPPKGKQGKGLYGEYFANPDLKGEPEHVRIDEEINFNYGKEGPFKDMSADNFSACWRGRFLPLKSGLYRFIVKSDDGSRLFLNDKKVIDHWGAHAATEKYFEIRLKAGEEVKVKIEYNEYGLDASMKFGWLFFEEPEKAIEALINVRITDRDGKVVAKNKEKFMIINHQLIQNIQKLHINNPHLWKAKADPYLYKVNIQIEDLNGNKVDAVEQPLGLRYFKVDKEKGLVLNDQPYHLYGVCRHQEWEGFGPALTDKHHEKDIEMILELGANGVRLAHYQQSDKIYSLCDENGLVVWAEIPNTPKYRGNNPAYLENCQSQLTELIKQNYNHPSILFWGLYNEISISAADVEVLHNTAKKLDPYRLTTQADFSQVNDRHHVTDISAWNWYFGWYYGEFDEYGKWFNDLHSEYPNLIAGLSEYGAGGCISQQQEKPERPDPNNSRFFPEQYQRYYHEQVWSAIKDRQDIWCKFIWNMFDFSWTNVKRGDRDFINHKGLITHDRKVKKDAFYFYKANWSDEPVLYIISRRNTQRKENSVPLEVYTNLEKVELYVNRTFISKKKMDSDIHKITWDKIKLSAGRNKISVIGYKGDKRYTDACEWTYYNDIQK